MDDETAQGRPDEGDSRSREQQQRSRGSVGSPSYVPFRGNCVHTIDDKGRVSLPSEFRKVVSGRSQAAVVLTNYISEGHRCVEGFSITAWEAFEEQLRSKSRFNSKLQRLENFYLSRATECTIDGSGRILLPAYLRNYAVLEREVVFTSSIHGFRVWDKRVWDVVFTAAEQALIDNPDLFSEVDL